jgi:hypothetical protein
MNSNVRCIQGLRAQTETGPVVELHMLGYVCNTNKSYGFFKKIIKGKSFKKK